MKKNINATEFKTEAEALEHFQSRGWYINSYSGGNGITLYNHGLPTRKTFLYRDSRGKWVVIRSNKTK